MPDRIRPDGNAKGTGPENKTLPPIVIPGEFFAESSALENE